ncbi:prephenate dehydratase [Demequina sp. NBRC 110053]|uniref:prephenate dehydratase n=1 Tax=Demequina sp. NBRC 110053 TaxID=1570342 RepID=UPI000A06124D|nr:prephenate dehydratase [Demequina sp. NBRC 110053]
MTHSPRYAYLGPAGTFTEAALYAMVGDTAIDAVPVVDVPAALGAVRAGEADFAVVAIENTVEGGVTATLDTLAEGDPLVILGESVLPVEFELVARQPTAHADIERVTAHSHAWAQVRRWAHATIPQAVFVPASSNAAGALAVAGREGVGGVDVDAALAPPGTAARLGLSLIESHVADNPHAATRFVRIGRPGDVPAPTGRDKTTLTVHLPTDRSGALLEMLEQFAARGVNLSRIESRPRWDRPGEYSFSIDALGHIAEERIADALAGLRRSCPLVVFLGSYPAVGSGVTAVPDGMTDRAFEEARAWVAGLRNGQP